MPFASSRNRLFRALRWIAAMLVVGISVWVSHQPSRLPRPITEGPTAIADRNQSVARCAACHQEIVERMKAAPHLNTLTPATAPQLAGRFAGTFSDSERQREFRFFDGAEQLHVTTDGVEQPVTLHWVFGSGSHAQTPVSVQADARGQWRILQHAVSWYPDHGLDWTLGATDFGGEISGGLEANGQTDVEPLGLERHGDWVAPAETLACFRCHSAQLDPQRLAEPGGVQPGLGCIRCHVNAETHAAEQEGQVVDGLPPMLGWEVSAREHVDRCGECHRRADQTPTDEITPQANHIVRFASVGLVQSKCFTGSQRRSQLRMDCLTCHDPHQRASRSAAFYSAQCQQCHQRDDVAACPQQPDSQDCIGCHMQKRETQPHLSFTDHWIR